MSSLSSLPLKSITNSSEFPYKSRALNVTQITSKPKNIVVCHLEPQNNHKREPKKWRKLVSTVVSTVAVITLNSNMPSMADINKYASADLGNVVHVNEDLRGTGRTLTIANGFLLPVDPWAPNIDSQSIASQLFAFSLFPYIGFLYFITKSKSAPKLTLFGFYFLLAFVGATIPAGIYAKLQYGTSLSNVDYLHGGAESLLTLTNLFIVLGLRAGIRRAKDEKETTSNLAPGINETDKSST